MPDTSNVALPDYQHQDLSIDQQRIDHLAAIVNCNVSQELDIAGVSIDFNDADVRAEREREILWFEKVSC